MERRSADRSARHTHDRHFDGIRNHSYPGSGTADDPYVLAAILAALSCFSIAFTSSAYAGGIIGVMGAFEVTNSVAQLGISLFVLGFAVGPLFWAPMSELYGRKPVFVGTLGALVVCNALSASAKSITQLLVFRALAGIVGSSPLSNAGAVIADMFPASERGLALSFFSFGPFMGPVLGPIVGGYLGAVESGWRAVLWLCTGLCGLLFIACTLFIPESFAPILLKRRATALSRETGNLYISILSHNTVEKTASGLFWTGLARPWAFLVLEPICLILSIYIAIVYATMYMFFAAFPTIFRQQRGWSAGQAGLAFIAMAIGMIAALFYMIYENERYKKRAAAAGGSAPPEARLPVCMVGGCLVPIGLFWFAWTSSPGIHWIVCLLGTTVFGAGNVLLYLSCFNYLVDVYLMYTASCTAGSSLLRSVLGAAFPLFTAAMYARLGVNWASSVPAFISLACVPFPFLFAKYGPAIRKRCRYAARAHDMAAKIQEKPST
ncbi:MFS general substrate transporter [Thozetella sp. PMI_491]|nr:MFS general substrate transporter [Thozetella sp. PMI_491]